MCSFEMVAWSVLVWFCLSFLMCFTKSLKAVSVFLSCKGVEAGCSACTSPFKDKMHLDRFCQYQGFIVITPKSPRPPASTSLTRIHSTEVPAEYASLDQSTDWKGENLGVPIDSRQLPLLLSEAHACLAGEWMVQSTSLTFSFPSFSSQRFP